MIVGTQEYNTLHRWIGRKYGPASKCEKCHTDRTQRFQWANISGDYKRDRNDFMQLCAKCHYKYDIDGHRNRRTTLRKYCMKGHPYTEQNTRWHKDGHRQCKECTKAYARIYMRKYRKLVI